MQIISRQEARERGLKRYFTGKPCKNGHTSERYISGSVCVECTINSAKKNYNADPEARKAYLRQYRKDNAEALKQKRTKFSEENRARINAAAAEYRTKNRTALAQRSSIYSKNNRESVNRAKRLYDRNRRANDPLYATRRRVCCLVKAAVRKMGYQKGTSTEAILGCSWDEFLLQIERQFLPGMTWENRHLWHIDHIVPIATAKTREEVLSLNHVSNLRPVWAKDNLTKSDKRLFLI